MKIILALISAIAITGCASTPQSHLSNTQFYRLKGETDQLTLRAAYTIDKKIIDPDEHRFILIINEKPYISMRTNLQGNGEISCTKDSADTSTCSDYEGHPVAASCIGSTANGRLSSVTCTAFIDNERAATFRF